MDSVRPGGRLLCSQQVTAGKMTGKCSDLSDILKAELIRFSNWLMGEGKEGEDM